MSVTALIVTYNRLEKLKKTLGATLLLPFKSIVIVNNASNDGTTEWLAKLTDDRIVVINSDVNDGGAGGFFRGAEWLSKYCNAEWILFYDDDAYPESNLLEKFILVDNDKIDVITTNVVSTDHLRCKMNIPWVKIPSTVFEVFSSLINNEKFIAQDTYNERIVTFSFVGTFIRTQVVKESFYKIRKYLFIYFDDVYYAWSLHLMKRIMWHYPSLTFYHDVPHTNVVMPPWKVYYLTRNLLWGRKYFKTKPPFSNLSIILRLIKYSSLVFKSDNKREYMKNIMRGICDGLFN
ncbi:MAG: glycosyltransferase [Pantoea sp. Morm]|uniref:glycosyltransferase n=1 Tax=Pantoea sp. Morm TaxID=2601250 RepID=UPI001D1B825A|nr:glycosyltransferase [Pantoea sp. Morm]